jgi:hypothetical protein
MEYTPKQLDAFLVIAQHRRRRELAEQLHIASLAARGEGKAIRDTIKELSGGR